MSIQGTPIGASIAGLGQAERVARDRVRKPHEKTGPARTADQLEIEVETAQATDAAKAVAGGDGEEAREDREEHPAYTPQGRAAPAPDRPSIDVQG